MTAATTEFPRALGRQRHAFVVALFVIVTFALLLLVPVTAATADPTPTATDNTTPPATASDALTVSLVSMTPEVLRPTDTLTVVTTLTNSSTVTIEEPVATLSVSRTRYSTRSNLAAWSNRTPAEDLGTAITSTSVPGPLAPGTSTTITFTVAASAITLTGGIDGWGPRGISVSITDTALPGSGTLAALRTYLLWFPIEDSAVIPLDVAVAVPIVGPAFDPLAPGTSAAALEETTTQGGRLASVLAATETTMGVTWVIDPVLVTTTPSAVISEPASSLAATTWAQKVLAAATGREVYALPEYDQDLTALTAAGVPQPIRQPLLTPLSSWRTDLAWPEAAEPDLATMTASAAAGAPVVVVPPGTLAPDPELTYTPTGTTVLTTDSGLVTALVPDLGLSNQLTTPTDASPAAARQRLLAELAIISRERPTEARQLLLTTPRDWFPNPEMARAQLAALNSAPWVRSVPASTLIEAASVTVPRTLPGAGDKPEGLVPGSMLAVLRDSTEKVTAVAQIVPDPTVYTLPANAAALAATSVAWRVDQVGRGTAVSHLVAQAAAIGGQVAITHGSDFTLISTGSALPLNVTNGSDQPVRVLVTLVPDDPRLVAVKPVTAEVPARGETEVHIPVRAVGSGDVTVKAILSTADGTIISTPFTFKVRVRADWENRGTAVGAGALVILLGAGIYRTIHRGRSSRRASGEEVALLEQTEALEHTDAVTGDVPTAPAPRLAADPDGSAGLTPDQQHGSEVPQ